MKLTRTTKSFSKEQNPGNWVIVDADNKTLGRLSTQIAEILRGKNKANYTPNAGCGDSVIVINAEKVKLTGKKLTQKNYYDYSGYIGGMKATSALKMLQTHPERVIETAVKGMMRKSKLARDLLGNLKVYKGSAHPHIAQKPVAVEVTK